MRSAFRLFMASIVLTVAAGFAWAQESSEPPPPPVPDAAVPVAELPPIPRSRCARPTQRTGRRPCAHAHHRSERPRRRARRGPDRPVPRAGDRGHDDYPRITKKTAKQPVEKPVEKPLMEATESYGPLPAKARPVAAGEQRRRRAGEHGARQEQRAPAAAAVGDRRDSPRENRARTSIGIGGWLLAGIVVAAMVSLITLLRRRRTQRKTSIVEFPALQSRVEADSGDAQLARTFLLSG